MSIATMTEGTQQRILCPICRASNRADARFCQQCGSDVLLDNIYRITRVIKEGGMGFVYKAVDAAGAEYAIKEMRDNFATGEERKEGIERFIEEAELLHNLNHPAIPQVYRSFIDEGRYYLSMEFIYGEDLEDVLKREKRFPEPVVLRWADQLCDVLEYMHGKGLIYRDMKPANIMIDRDGNVKLVDFGIAKLLQPGQRNTMVGTPGYAPPEQYQGLATVESDIYALAATLHHLLTGRDPRDHPPFTFPPANTVNRAVSAQTTKALEKALSMEVGDRFHSADAFRRALPIPTGDRRPTLPFDLGRDEERQPAGAPAAQSRRVQPAAPARPAPRRRGRVRRVVAAVLLAIGLAGTGVVVAPQVLPALQSLVTNQAPAANPPAGNVAQAFATDVTVTLPTDSDQTTIQNALQDAYARAARQQHSGAQVDTMSPPQVEGTVSVSDLGTGESAFRATMTGTIDVPQQ